jgi:hypothetical protein
MDEILILSESAWRPFESICRARGWPLYDGVATAGEESDTHVMCEAGNDGNPDLIRSYG